VGGSGNSPGGGATSAAGSSSTNIAGNSSTSTAGNSSSGSGGNSSVSTAGGSSVNVTSDSCSATVSGVTIDLPPPQQCGNQYWVKDCQAGGSTCKGQCAGYANSCQQSLSTHAGTYDNMVAFACPRWMLYSDEMRQAAINDGNSMFNYAVVGHDIDNGGIDGTGASTCCQCYQLVFDYPAENQAWVDPNNSASPVSALPIPPPLIVQSFNTATNGPDDFDVFMAAGGFGGNNACDPTASMKDISGVYAYTAYPAEGANNGGVKAANKYSECKTITQWVTKDSISSAACQAKVSADCNQITASSSQVTKESRCSCIQSNQPTTFYHMNWFVHAMKVECPKALTQVTGCRLKSQGLPAVDKTVTTGAQAASNAGFKEKASNGKHFSTTTMQDCCMPSCSAQDWVAGKGLVPDGQYNSFYSCDQSGVPQTM
jgi:hypothetical protein